MRKMKKGDKIINVKRYIMLKNFWEYYITDRYNDDSDIQEAYVLGHEWELGDVYLPEILPYAKFDISGKDFKNTEMFPADDFSWVE